ncbi:MAG: penicillin-binding protein [bacterium]
MALRSSIVKRFNVIYALIAVFFLLAFAKMVYTITIEREEWIALSKTLQRKNRDIAPERGNIYSYDGRLISTKMPDYTIYMDTRVPALHEKENKLYKENIDTLSICLANKFGDKTAREYRKMIDDAFNRGEGRLKLYPKRISYIDLQDVKSFPLFNLGQYKSGLFAQEYVKRENLYGDLAKRTVGELYGSSGKGQYGLELYYDSILSGKPGVERGSRIGNKWIYLTETEAENGYDLVTTIDIDLQDICESVLRNEVERVKPKSSILILMEVKTGEIKSIVNLVRNESDGTYGESQNMAMADMSEPGSTFKTLSLMVALDDNVCDTGDVYNIHHGRYQFYDSWMTDHNWRKGGYDSLTVSMILANSSNVGISKLINDHYKDRPEEFIEKIYASGFADDLNLEIPGAPVPHIASPKDKNWSGISLPWLSIGYNSQIPPIYTLNFYNTIANNGKMMKPYLVKEILSNGKVIKEFEPTEMRSSICKISTLKKLQGMLEGVVERGTAKPYASEHFKIAGKTGTAQLNYGKGMIVKHQLSFAGYFPAENPKYSIIVVVKEPQAIPTSAMSAGVAKKVAERVYAQKINCDIASERKKLHQSNIEKEAPKVKAGERKTTEQAMKNVGVKYHSDKSGDWVNISYNEENSNVECNNRPITENSVPNVIGMGAEDAVYLIERAGMYAQIFGKGRVVKQSIRGGEPIRKGATVTIELK